MFGTKDQPCWLAEACQFSVLLLQSTCQSVCCACIHTMLDIVPKLYRLTGVVADTGCMHWQGWLPVEEDGCPAGEGPHDGVAHPMLGRLAGHAQPVGQQHQGGSPAGQPHCRPQSRVGRAAGTCHTSKPNEAWYQLQSRVGRAAGTCHTSKPGEAWYQLQSRVGRADGESCPELQNSHTSQICVSRSLHRWNLLRKCMLTPGVGFSAG